MREGCSYKYPPLSITRYSFIQLCELKQCRVKNLPHGLTRQHRVRTSSCGTTRYIAFVEKAQEQITDVRPKLFRCRLGLLSCRSSNALMSAFSSAVTKSQLHFLFLICFSTGSWLVLTHSAFLLIISSHFWPETIFLIFLLDILQHGIYDILCL